MSTLAEKIVQYIVDKEAERVVERVNAVAENIGVESSALRKALKPYFIQAVEKHFS